MDRTSLSWPVVPDQPPPATHHGWARIVTITTAPDLWPNMDRSTPTAKAWITIWDTLGSNIWIGLADVIEHVEYAHPDVKRKTIDNLIRRARTARIVQRKGGYSRKHQRDTRMIRRHPATTQETTAS